MLRKITLIIDSALKREMEIPEGGMGRILRNSKGYWESMKLVGEILEIGLAEEHDGEWYKGPHQLGILTSPLSHEFPKYCAIVEKSNRVEAVIRWIPNSHFQMDVNFFEPEDTDSTGHLMFSMSLDGHAILIGWTLHKIVISPERGLKVEALCKFEFDRSHPVYKGSIGVIEAVQPDWFIVNWGHISKTHNVGDRDVKILPKK
jgi:hypothetical protein